MHLLCNRMNYVTLTVKKYCRHVFIVIYIYLNFIQVFFCKQFRRVHFGFQEYTCTVYISKCVYVRCLFCSQNNFVCGKGRYINHTIKSAQRWENGWEFDETKFWYYYSNPSENLILNIKFYRNRLHCNDAEHNRWTNQKMQYSWNGFLSLIYFLLLKL